MVDSALPPTPATGRGEEAPASLPTFNEKAIPGPVQAARLCVEFVPATEDLARELAPRVRAADVAEIWASDRSTPLEAMLEGLGLSTYARAALFDGKVACLWGLVPLRRSVVHGVTAAAWLITSDLIERHPRAFWRGCREELPRLFEQADLLVNAIDARHTQALRWARRLRFRVDRPVPHGMNGEPFCWFTVSKEDVACALR